MIFKKPKTIQSLHPPKVNPAKVRPNIQIAVIDDEPFPYMDILRQHRYNITKMDDLAEIQFVESYQIVICDIKGVGKAFGSRKEGAHLIEEMRKLYPAKVLIAYTGHTFDASYNGFFQMCDMTLKKDIDSDDWVERLDEAIKIATDPKKRWMKIRDYLLEHNIPITTVAELEDEYVSIIEKKQENFSSKVMAKVPDELRGALEGFAVNVLVKLLTQAG